MAPAAGKKVPCLVTGGAGFLGKNLVQQLVQSGTYEVTIFDIRDSQIEGVKTIVGDLRDLEQVAAAVKGTRVIFHCATAAPAAENTGNRQMMHDVNVIGTQNVLTAAARHGVPKLVYTSSASVVFEGRDLIGVDESAPYATKPLDYYTSTKIEGEKLVRAANGRGGLATVALRPSGIFGEHDPLLVPVIVEKAREGKMKYIIGDGKNLMDFTYVGNVAQAHLQAANALSSDSPLAGSAYFITNADPRPFWTFMGDILEPLGYERPHVRLPATPLYCIACVVGFFIWLLTALGLTLKPSEFTPMRIRIASANRNLKCDKARKEFGYVPGVTVDEGLKRTTAFFSHLKKGVVGKKKS